MGFGFKSFLKGVRLVPVASTGVSQKGDLELLDASSKINYFNGSTASPLVSESHAATLTNKTIDAPANTITNIANGNISPTAAIAYSKLNLVNSIVNADINAAAAIAYSKLNLLNSIVNADINAAAAIAYSKLNLLNSIVDTDINASAAITRSKLASGTAFRILANNALGVMSENVALTAAHVIFADANGQLAGEQFLAKARGGSAQDNSALNFPATGTLATLAGTEIFTNKDLDGGTAANNRRITIPKATFATLTSLTRKEGTVVYATDTQQPYYDNGTALVAIESNSPVNASFLGNLTSSIASGAEVKLGTSGSLEYDTNSALSSGNYTVPVTGVYTLTASYGLSNLAVNGSSASIRFYKNGVISKTVVRTMDGGTGSSNEFMAVNGSCDIFATIGDVLTIFAYQDNATASARTLNNAFGAHTNLQFIQFKLNR